MRSCGAEQNRLNLLTAQRRRDGIQLVVMLLQDGGGARQAALQQVVNLLIDDAAHFLGDVRAGLREVAAQEDLLLAAEERTCRDTLLPTYVLSFDIDSDTQIQRSNAIADIQI